MMRVCRLLCFVIVLCAGLLPGRPAWCQPVLPLPTLRELMATPDTLIKAQLRWAKLVEGRQAYLFIEGGTAEYRDPNWAPGPVHLSFDLARHRELVRVLLHSRLGPPDGAARRKSGPAPEDRVLEFWGRSSKGWEVVARWTLATRVWRQRHKALYQLLEPMFQVPAKE